MKKKSILLIPLVVVPFLSGCSNSEPNADWTVLTYICAADLETKSGCYQKALNKVSQLTPTDKVNYIVQIGGTSEYSQLYEAPGILRDTSKNYRYSYKTKGTFTKEYEGPVTNFSEPYTLSSFIKWGKEKYPAKHYKLILCDHGGGAYYGFSMDTNFCSPTYIDHHAIMSLDEIETALTDGGLHFDLIDINACEMNSVETMQVLANHTNYLLGHEECSSNTGDSLSERANYLFTNHTKAPLELAKELTEIMGNKELKDGVRKRTLVSLIDLKNTSSFTEHFNKFWKVARNYVNDATVQKSITNALEHGDRMTSAENRDLVSFLSKFDSSSPLYSEAQELIKLVKESVLVKKSGDAHPNAGGISFYSDNLMSTDQFDHFTKGETYNPEYLAYLDDITPWWKAPESVYEKVEKTNPESIGGNNVTFTNNFDKWDETGATCQIKTGKDATYKVEGMVYARVNNSTYYYIGKDTNITYDKEKDIYTAPKVKSWGYLKHTQNEETTYSLLTLDATSFDASSTLYSIPIMLNMRIGSLATLRPANIITTLDNASLNFDIHGICSYVSEYSKIPDGEYMPWPSGTDKGFFVPMYYNITSGYRKGNKTRVEELSKEVGYSEEEQIDIVYRNLDKGSYGYQFVVTDMYGHEITRSELFDYKIA